VRAEDIYVRMKSEMMRREVRGEFRNRPYDDVIRDCIDLMFQEVSKAVADALKPAQKVGRWACASFYGMPVPSDVFIPKPHTFDDTWRLFAGRW
jgi:hypothetical protein